MESIYLKLMSEIRLINASLLILSEEVNQNHFKGWVTRKTVLKFFDYSTNQLRLLEKKNLIDVSIVGRRKFYSVESIIQLIEKNKKCNNG